MLVARALPSTQSVLAGRMGISTDSKHDEFRGAICGNSSILMEVDHLRTAAARLRNQLHGPADTRECCRPHQPRISSLAGAIREYRGGFRLCLAAGSIVFGWLADRLSVRTLYACVLTMWSLAGFAAGFVRSYDELLICRVVLGFFEAAHWPCGIRTTRALLDPRERSLGNGVLQSGTSIGAVVTR
jgi:hypothetical protein